MDLDAEVIRMRKRLTDVETRQSAEASASAAETLDKITRDIEALKKRVADLEKAKGKQS